VVFAYFWKAFSLKLFCTGCTARRITENLLCCFALWTVQFKRDRVVGQRNSHIKKQKRSVDGSFLGRFGVADTFGKVICVMCSKEIAEESLKPNKLLRHMNTYKDVASLTDEGRKCVFKQRFEQLTKCHAFLRQSLTKKQRVEVFSYKAAYIVAREKWPYVEGEVAIKPVLEGFVEIFEGEVFQKTVRDAFAGFALSNVKVKLTLTRYQDCLMKEHEYMKHSLKNCGEKNMDNSV